MKNNINWLDLIFIILSGLLLMFISVMPIWMIAYFYNCYLNEPVYYEKYEIVDYNDNNIIAYNCSSGGYRSGSTMQCKLKDGTILSVKQYKHVGSEYIGIRKDIEMR